MSSGIGGDIRRPQPMPGASESGKPVASYRGFAGTIASICEMGLRLEDFIAMARAGRTTDPKVALFVDEWDALSVVEQNDAGAADAVCERAGIEPRELLRIIAEEGCRWAMSLSQMMACAALPSLVACSVKRALTDKGTADRKMLLHATRYLPMPRG